jgi:hypothetical protein
MRRFEVPITCAVVLTAISLILLSSSALTGGASFPAERQSGAFFVSVVGPVGASSPGDGVLGPSGTEKEAIEDGIADSLALAIVLFLWPSGGRLLLYPFYNPLRPSTIYGSVLERPD